MNLAQKALQDLFPEKDEQRELLINYSGRFSSYNANVKYTSEKIQFSLSKDYKELSEEIQQGVIEHLLCKIYGKDKKSSNQDLYLSFMKHLSKVAKIHEKDDYLLSRFKVINEQYFSGMMSEPNIKWGQKAYRKLGHYEYASDTIVISSIFYPAKEDEKIQALMDFVIYHEMLHKKHQFDNTKKRAVHHSKAFREEEKLWHDKEIEKKLTWFLRKKKLTNALFGW